ncbi:MAG TPA: VanZ family protein [Longimicrobiales bacterium]|nr:VanZ family protein [Longimicrobiales bacterium]
MTNPPGFARVLERTRIPIRVGYVAVLFLATLSWFRIDADAQAVARRLQRMLDPSVSARDAIDGARNVLLFAGWGLVWMVTAAPGSTWVALRNAVATGAALSLLVEGLQLFSDSRTASVLDLATNTGGTVLGALALVAMVLALSSRRDRKSFVGVPAAIFAVSCTLALAGEALVPLYRQDLAPWATGGPLQRLSMALQGLRWSGAGAWPLGDLLLFLPGGAFAVAALGEAGLPYRRAAAAATGGGALLFTLAEIAHGALGMEILGGAAVVHATAFGAGALLGAWGLPAFTRSVRGVHRPRILLGGYAAWCLVWALRPYALESSLGAVAGKLATEWWIPLRFLGSRVDTFSVVDVVGGFFLFLPLGGLLAVWPLRLRGGLAVFLPALWFAALLEVSQTLVLTRTLDITDFLVQAAGAVIGWTMVRRAGFRPYGEQLP